jgi:hypothetical protein
MTAELWVLAGLAAVLITITIGLLTWPQRKSLDDKQAHTTMIGPENKRRGHSDNTDVWAIIQRVERESRKRKRQ